MVCRFLPSPLGRLQLIHGEHVNELPGFTHKSDHLTAALFSKHGRPTSAASTVFTDARFVNVIFNYCMLKTQFFFLKKMLLELCP